MIGPGLGFTPSPFFFKLPGSSVVWVAERKDWVWASELLELRFARPFHSWLSAFADEPFAVLLDSAAAPGAYSMLAIAPAAVLSAWASSRTAADGTGEIELRLWGEQRFAEAAQIRRFEGRPFAELARLLDDWTLPAELRAHIPGPFATGAIGVAGHDAGRFLERWPEQAARDLDLPALCFLCVDALLLHEHASGRSFLCASARGPDEGSARAACARLAGQLMARVRAALARAPAPRVCRVGEVRAYADEAAYCDTVRAAQEQIAAGNIFEVNTSHRLEARFTGDTSALYAALRAQSPAAFACHVITPWAQLLSSSPERFLKLSADRWAESRPIKGTRPRGETPEEDARLRSELERSEKDRAENVMIVDLVRNDLGRVCEIGSISVPERMIVETHPRVFHLVSSVRGRLAPQHHALDLFTACFPPGSMTGAPKISALHIIDALEPYRRGFYAGAVGYFDAGLGMDFSVIIRSFVLVGERCTFNVGGAVVADSEPAAEHRETLDKARGLLLALAQLRAASGGG